MYKLITYFLYYCISGYHGIAFRHTYMYEKYVISIVAILNEIFIPVDRITFLKIYCSINQTSICIEVYF